MASVFREFSDLYNEFKMKFPRHPLKEELQAKIAHGKFPDERWLKENIEKMKELLLPLWMRSRDAAPKEASSEATSILNEENRNTLNSFGQSA